MSDRHKIIRQVLDVNVLENKNVYQVQSRVRDIYYDQLVPLLEAEFDRIAPDDRMIIIDRLEIDLIILGCHRHSELFGSLTNATDKGLLNKCSRPVMFVPLP